MKEKIVTLTKRFFRASWYYIGGVVRQMRNEEGLLLASGIAFNAVLCSIPLLLLFTWVLGTFLESSESAIHWIDGVVDAAFKGQPYAETIKNTLKRILSNIITYRASYGIFGGAVLVWTGTSLFSSVRSALHRVFHTRSTKNLFLSILEDIVWVFIIGILFVALYFFSWLSGIVDAILAQIPGLEQIDFTLFGQAFPLAVSFGLTLFMLFIVFRFIPDNRPPTRVAALAALTTSILWEAAARMFAWYLAEFHSFRELYGTYAFLLVLLVWIYYSSVVFVVGGIVGQLYSERRSSSHTTSH
jgi:membrane protein